MIVPFLMTLMTSYDRPYLWAFYKFLDEAKKNNLPIIAQEEYFTLPSELAEKGRSEVVSETFVRNARLNYELPKDEDLDKIIKYIIPYSLQKRVIDDKKSINNAYISLLTEVWPELYDLLVGFVDDINSKYEEKIEAFITMSHNPTLSKIAEERNIKVIHMEMGTFREPTYIKTAYFDFENLYGDASTELRYKRFLEQKDDTVAILERKEILAILLERNSMHYLNRLEQKPEFEIGLALGYAIWPIYMVNTYYNDEELLYRTSKQYDFNDILVRRHPGDPAGAAYPKYDYLRDASANTIEFILKCKRVASVASNVSMEAMLFGRTPYVATECPYYYNTEHNIENINAKIAELEYINFYCFVYLVPFTLLWDQNYMKWRLTNPSEIEIYKRHIQEYLNEKNIAENVLQVNAKDRFNKILEAQDYDLKADYANIDVKPASKFTVGAYQREIIRLRKLLEEQEKDDKR